MRIDLTLAQINGLKMHFADEFEEDERGWLDALEGETDAFELVRRLLEKLEAEEGDRDQLKEQIENRKARMDRCTKRMDVQRNAIMAVMHAANIDKLPLPEATCSLRQIAASLKVNDPKAVPEEFTVPDPKPDLAKIKAQFTTDAEALPNWLRVEPERPSLTIRRK